MRSVVVAILGLCLSSPVFADRIVLVYGDVLEGKVVSQTDTTVTIQGPYGERVMNKSDIREVLPDPATGTPTAPATAPAPSTPPMAPPAVTAPAVAPEFAPQEVPAAGPDGWPVDDMPVAQPQPQGVLTPTLPTLPPRDGAAQSPAPTAFVPPPANQAPSPYDLIRANAEMQSKWTDLDIAYVQRAFAMGQSTETRCAARIIPPNYMRAKMVTAIPPSQQFPQGGEVEYDMYRAKGSLWQTAKLPGQPIQYLKMDASRIERQSAAKSMESFQLGFAGTSTDETMLQPFARNSTIVGAEVIEGNDCWVLETRYTPEVIETQTRRYPPEVRQTVQQQLGQQIGVIRNWIGKTDLVQRRMESFMPDGSPLLAMIVTSVKPNTGMDPQALRMKVPKGTAWVDITEMVAGGVNKVMSGQPIMPGGAQAQAGQPAPAPQQAPYAAQQPMQPQQAMQYAPQPQVQQYQQQAYPQQQQMYPQQGGQPYQQTYIQQGVPGAAVQPQQQQQQQSGSGGGFLSRLFGKKNQQTQQTQPIPQYGGASTSGNTTMMVPVINGQPQFPTQTQ